MRPGLAAGEDEDAPLAVHRRGDRRGVAGPPRRLAGTGSPGHAAGLQVEGRHAGAMWRADVDDQLITFSTSGVLLTPKKFCVNLNSFEQVTFPHDPAGGKFDTVQGSLGLDRCRPDCRRRSSPPR